MRLTLIAVLLCLGCASSSAPTTYNQAAMPLPPIEAPAFNPAEDAPHTFEPGRPSPVQPGPRPTRVLPQDEHTRREPGIWASDAPDESPGVEVKLFGVPIAAPSLPQQKTETARCAEQARLVFNEEAYTKRDPTWLKCFANAIIHACLDTEKRKLEALAEGATLLEVARLNALGPAAALAENEVERLCPKKKDTETDKARHDMRAFTRKTEWAQ